MIKNIAEQQLVGHVFTSENGDENGSFASLWDDLLAGDFFTKLDVLTDQPNRSGLVIFSPYGAIMYWIGSVLPTEVAIPEGYQQFKLPASQVAEVAEKSRGMVTQLPLSLSFNHVLERLEQTGVTVPEHLGQTDRPYFITIYPLNTDGQAESVIYRVYLEMNPPEIFDEYD